MIFWEHIKGLNVSGTTKAWSYINFRTTVAGNTSSDVNMTCNPTVGFGDSGYSVNNKNYILTSHMTDGYINNSFSFYNNVTVRGSLVVQNGASTPTLTLQSTSSESQITASSHLGIDIPSSTKCTIRQNNQEKITVESNGKITINPGSGCDIIGQLTVGNSNSANDIKAYGYCEALYFNATSDYRAKKDFKLLDVNALELIKKVRLYSFKYKDSNQPSIGIIAQDVQDVSIEGFDLVDNKTATGENFDYMSIHESKLIYILWKAIQEQQKEIEELKQQLNK